MKRILLFGIFLIFSASLIGCNSSEQTKVTTDKTQKNTEEGPWEDIENGIREIDVRDVQAGKGTIIKATNEWVKSDGKTLIAVQCVVDNQNRPALYVSKLVGQDGDYKTYSLPNLNAGTPRITKVNEQTLDVYITTDKGETFIFNLNSRTFDKLTEGEVSKSEKQEYISEVEALEIAKEMNNNKNAEWTVNFDKNAEEGSEKTTKAWVVEALYPFGNKTVYYIDAITGEPSAVAEIEAPHKQDNNSSCETAPKTLNWDGKKYSLETKNTKSLEPATKLGYVECSNDKFIVSNGDKNSMIVYAVGTANHRNEIIIIGKWGSALYSPVKGDDED
jgi:hypothetical protein